MVGVCALLGFMAEFHFSHCYEKITVDIIHTSLQEVEAARDGAASVTKDLVNLQTGEVSELNERAKDLEEGTIPLDSKCK